MRVKKVNGRVLGGDLTNAQRTAMNIEIQKQLAEHTRKHNLEIEATFLWYLHEELGFGPERLKRVFMGIAPMLDELCDRYEMYEDGDDIWLCAQKIKEYGVDLEQWDKERGD